MEISVIIALVVLAGSGVGVWVNHNNKVTEVKTRLTIVEQDLKEHKSLAQGVVDRLREEVKNDVEKLVDKMDDMSEKLNTLIGEIKAMRKQ